MQKMKATGTKKTRLMESLLIFTKVLAHDIIKA
jgi:hypothetical protein